ncbi:MAG: ATP-binding protein [Desulfovibrionaceae bacterium]|nr:ATP-binding protein [Desulfovibrionaceae bacterium]
MQRNLSSENDGGYHKKRRMPEIWIAVLLLMFSLCGTWAQLTIYGLDSWTFLILFNLNFIILLLICFLVIRNIVKLLLERRRNVFGSRIRTKLVFTFVCLSLIPTILMFLTSNRLVVRSVDYWFTSQTENVQQSAIDIGQQFYNAAANRLKQRAQVLAEMLKNTENPDALLASQQKFGLSFVGMTSRQQAFSWHANNDKTAPLWDNIRNLINWKELSTAGSTSLLWTTEDADYIIFITALASNDRFLIEGEYLGGGLLTRLDRMSDGFAEYARVKQLKKPLKVSFSLILGVLGMTIIFGSIWFGFRLSKEILAPIVQLAEATEQVARGDLNLCLNDQGNDELNTLVRAFNRMAGDLAVSRTSLTQANRELEAHSRYIESVLNNITTGILTIDGEGRVRTVNQALCKMFGMSRERFEGMQAISLLPERYRRLYTSMEKMLSLYPERVWHRQIDLHSGNRTWKLSVHAMAFPHNSDGFSSIVLALDDISELEKMQRMLVWREVARRIAHEIKNPLTPIKLSAQRLEKKFSSDISDPVFLQCTGMIVRQVERLQNMVQEFSSFSKLPEIHLVPGNLIPILEELVTTFSNAHPGILWELNTDPYIPPIELDQQALYRAFLNLYTNAVDALSQQPADREKRVLTTVVFDRSAGCLRCSIDDNGPGLAEDADFDAVFEPYFTKKQTGTGLGLTIVKSIISDHHGTVHAEAIPQGGLSIVIEIPCPDVSSLPATVLPEQA